MTAASDTGVVSRGRFFVWLSWLFLFIAFAGFWPTYWAPLLSGEFVGKPVLHVHAIAMLAWTGLYVWQVHQVSRGRIQDHRAWGMLGIALITLVAVSVVLSAINSIKVAEGIGMADEARAFSIVSLSAIVLILALIAAAVRFIHKPDFHKRLMTLSFVPLLEAPMARPYMVLLSPPDAVGPPPVFVTVAPALTINLIIVAMLVYDRRVLGKFHPATVWGGASIVAVQALCLPLAGTPAWMAIARFVESLAG